MSEGQLLESVLARDDLAWRELLRRYRGLMYRCINKVLFRYDSAVSNEDLNEIFADLCVNLLRDDMHKLRAYDPARGSRLGSWLGLLAIKTAYDFLRVTARRPLVDGIEGALDNARSDSSPLDEVIERERWGHVNTLLSRLSSRDQQFVELCYAEGLAPERIASVLRISVKTVYSKKNKVAARLKLAATACGEPAVECLAA